MSTNTSYGFAFNDSYYTTLFIISLFTLILDIMVIILNYYYNSNKTNLCFTVVNICISSWFRCFTLIATWQQKKEDGEQTESIHLVNFCSIFAAIGLIAKFSQDIWVCIMSASFYYRLLYPSEDSDEDKTKWLLVKIISYVIAVFIPTLIAIILLFTGSLGLGNICCWIKNSEGILRSAFRYSLLAIKWITILINGFFCFKIFSFAHSLDSSLNDDEENSLKKLQIIVFTFPFNQFIEALFSTASAFTNSEGFKKFAFVVGGIQSLCYSISFFFFTRGWDNIKKMCGISDREVQNLQ